MNKIQGLNCNRQQNQGKIRIPLDVVRNATDRSLNIRFEVGDGLPGGLAIYGERFGRYPLDPTLLFE